MRRVCISCGLFARMGQLLSSPLADARQALHMLRFGLGRKGGPTEQWPILAERWMKQRGFICSETLDAGVPYGIRTRVAAVKGRCPRPLDERD